jgi:hypothetical protein
MSTYTGRETVSANVDGLNQSWLLERDWSGSRMSHALGTSVQAKGRGGCRKDGEECKRGDLHSFRCGGFGVVLLL